MKPKISAVIITKNEEAQIGVCIASLIEVVDEVVVLDDFSKDKTKEICARYNAVFYQRRFTDFADAKNFANSLATHDYILSLDADEQLSKELKQAIQTCPFDKTGYEIARLTNYCGQWIYHCGWYPSKAIRLFEKKSAQWTNSVHEKIMLTSNEVGHLKGDILHYSYRSFASHMKKNQLYASMMGQRYAQKKRATILFLFFAPVYEFLQNYFIKRGFLDGYYGFIICMMMAYYKFCKYASVIDYKSS